MAEEGAARADAKQGLGVEEVHRREQNTRCLCSMAVPVCDVDEIAESDSTSKNEALI